MTKTSPLHAFVLGMAMAGAGAARLAAGDVAFSAQAPNPCALLTSSDIQSLATTSVGEGVPTSTPAVGSVSCRYTSGVGVNRLTVNVVVTEQARMFPGLSPDQIKQRLAASIKAGTTDEVVSGIGEAAVFKSDSPYYATATAALKGRILEVRVDGAVAREKKNEVISLLKAAASKL